MTSEISRKQFREFQKHLSYSIAYDLLNDYPDVYGHIWSVRLGQPWPGRMLDAGNYLYVLKPDGEIRVPCLPHNSLDMHHPQLANREQVIGAGLFNWTGSDITCIDNKSGCYAPDGESLYIVSEAFKFYNVPLNANLHFDNFLHY